MSISRKLYRSERDRSERAFINRYHCSVHEMRGVRRLGASRNPIAERALIKVIMGLWFGVSV